MSRSSTLRGQAPLYEVISDILKRNIQSGRLPTGLVLIEGPIARVMMTSRAPVQVALRKLHEEGLIHRFRGRGYLVGAATADIGPIRRPIDEFQLDIPEQSKSSLEVRGTWMRVYDQVEADVAACQVFGEFRLVETELADFLGVSRTVARDVLSRLNERGLIRKGASSHWLAGPLTARVLREKYQLRAIVEPAALLLAADFIEPAEITKVRDEIRQGLTRETDAYEEAFQKHCLERAPNEALVEMIRNNRLLLSSVNEALNRLGLPADHVAIDQYRILFDLIGSRQINSAAEYLKEHLRLLADKNLARLKIVALVPEAEAIPRYLSPL
ncbi:GntR family transcriptional regulator [Rhodobacteraceae bacterium B1Z28]|uniref:GntR family transcriptional regulator n=1 Tax=Ruegeria haliotis TaxID=2747601 RepID=A0ABX2PWI2_9RHOB|nr:GntR family transcriptional regulator [Ruegeria haliotis]NVO58568.1 GntR family transcriptional regulator [Ruegeria haliotis]